MAKPVFTAADQAKQGLVTFSHPLNPGRSEMRGLSLSEAAGLGRTAVHLAVLPPGKESFVYHSHLREEEWLYVLEGRGRMEIAGVFHELGPGDFVGFAAPSAPHHLSNPYETDLKYLVGGERTGVEVAEFPRLGKVMVRHGSNATLYPLDGAQDFNALVEGGK